MMNLKQLGLLLCHLYACFLGVGANDSLLNTLQDHIIPKENSREYYKSEPWPKASLEGSGVFNCLDVPDSAVLCNSNGSINRVLTCTCVTYNRDHNTLTIGNCIYNCYPQVYYWDTYSVLPSNVSDWNGLMCDRYNRRGMLCGQCKHDHYVPVYSYNVACVLCSHNKDWWKLIFVAILPLTVFYMFIMIFKINIHSSYLQGYVFYCQAVTILPLSRNLQVIGTREAGIFKYYVYVLGSIYGIWNLDFFRFFSPDICLQTGSLVTTSVDLIIAAYPIILLILTYILIKAYDKKIQIIVLLWKPFKMLLERFDSSFNYKTSLIDSFSTFYFLIGMKCMNVCADLLLPVELYFLSSDHVTSEYRLYYDPAMTYFGTSHLPYAIMALGVFFIVGLFPTLLMLIYPFQYFQKLLKLLPQIWRIYMNTFVDNVQCCYKDGTEKGGRDSRWLSGFVFGTPMMFMIVYGFTFNSSFFVLFAIILTVLILLLILVNPYKEKYSDVSTSTIIHFLLIASCYVMCDAHGISERPAIITYILLFVITILPFIYIVSKSFHQCWQKTSNNNSSYQ